MSGISSSGYECDDFHADDIIDINNKEACDKAIATQIFLWSKCRNWATRTMCTTLRTKLLYLPSGANLGEEQVLPTAGHQSLRAHVKATANMTKFFEKLDRCSIQIITLHGYKFLDPDYQANTTAEDCTDDYERKTHWQPKHKVSLTHIQQS
jgi:hypothetical protein